MKWITTILVLVVLSVGTASASTVFLADTATAVENDSLYRNFKRKLDTKVFDSSTSQTSQNISYSVKVLPNPIQNVLRFKVDNDLIGTMSIKLVSYDGQISKDFEIEKNQEIIRQTIPMTDVPRGAYILQIQQGDYFAYKQIIKD